MRQKSSKFNIQEHLKLVRKEREIEELRKLARNYVSRAIEKGLNPLHAYVLMSS